MLIRRAYVTLLELLLVIAILGLIAGFIGINATKAWRNQRFQTEVSLVVDQLRLAQDLMLIFNTNVQVKFVQEQDGIDFRLVFDTPLPQRWAQELNRSHDKLKSIQVINFDDKLQSTDHAVPPDPEKTVSVKFLSGGSRMSRGYIRLSTSQFNTEGVLTRYICLSGHPAPITSTVVPPLSDECSVFDENFEPTLTERVRDEIKSTGT